MKEPLGDDCVKKIVRIQGENYYLTVGSNFVHITIPRENDPNSTREREAMEVLAQTINEIQGGANDEDKG
jgi:hypothetical protein